MLLVDGVKEFTKSWRFDWNNGKVNTIMKLNLIIVMIVDMKERICSS